MTQILILCDVKLFLVTPQLEVCRGVDCKGDSTRIASGRADRRPRAPRRDSGLGIH